VNSKDLPMVMTEVRSQYEVCNLHHNMRSFSISLTNLRGFFSFPAEDDGFLFDFGFDVLSSPSASSAYISTHEMK